MFNPLVKILGVIALVFTTAVNAEEKDPFDITVYGSFLHTGTVPNALFFFNDIEQYDSFELRRAIRNHDIDIVVLASDGGSVWEGLNMAGIIHDKGIATYVPELPEKLGCYSACSFMFFGGKIRQADGILAVHQAGAYGSERDKANAKVSETQQNTQFTVSEIIGFLNEFETPPWVFEKMFRSREVYFFDEDEKEPEISEEEQLRLAVIEIQKLLNAAGCNAGVADGIWGRRTQAAAVLFAKTAKLPTEKKQLISDSFIQQLRLAPSGFCPKPKINKTSASASLAGLWSVRTDCNGNRVIKGAGFAKYKSRTGSTEHYSITYSNELKDEGAGSLVHITGSKSASVRLKLRNEWYHYPLVKISNSRWQGKSKSGCQITFSW